MYVHCANMYVFCTTRYVYTHAHTNIGMYVCYVRCVRACVTCMHTHYNDEWRGLPRRDANQGAAEVHAEVCAVIVDAV